MDELEKVVVGIDGSGAALQAARYGAMRASRAGVPLTLVHVVPEYVPITPMRPLTPEDLEELGHRLLAEARSVVAESAPDLDVATTVRTGSAVRELVDAAGPAGLLVLGHETTPAWARVFIGAVTMGVAARAACPMVSVPSGWSRPDGSEGPVVVGYKCADQDGALLGHAFRTAAARGTRLVVLHAWELPGYYDNIIAGRAHDEEWNAEARRRIAEQLDALREDEPGPEAEERVVHEQPARALREASRGADLLILGRRGTGRAPWHLGGTARALLRESACPVEVVPPAAVEGEEEAFELEREGVPLK